MQEDRKNKGHSRDSTMSFLSPRYLNIWSYEGLVAQTQEVRPYQDILKGLEEDQRYPFVHVDNDIVWTTKRQKGQMRINLGQAEDRKRTYKGPHRQKVSSIVCEM